MSEIYILAESEFVEGRESEALAVLEELCERTHADDPGCLVYAVYRVDGESKRIVMIEKWASQEELDRHLESDHVKAKVAASEGVFVGPTKASFLQPAGLGAADQSSY